jgi:hypothetical protein
LEQACTVPCPLFSFLKVSALRLADKQQWLRHSAAIPSQAANQFYQLLFGNSPLAIPLQQFFSLQQSSLQPTPAPPNQKASVSFIPSGKQGGEAQFLGRGVTLQQEKSAFLLLSLNINNLGKAAELHLAFSLSSAAGAVPNLSLQII